jgi:hypothetical protein
MNGSKFAPNDNCKCWALFGVLKGVGIPYPPHTIGKIYSIIYLFNKGDPAVLFLIFRISANQSK